MYSTVPMHVFSPRAKRAIVCLRESGTRRLPRARCTSSATANKSAANNAWLATTWVQVKPAAYVIFTVVVWAP